jgi:hypothetical protein
MRRPIEPPPRVATAQEKRVLAIFPKVTILFVVVNQTIIIEEDEKFRSYV